MKPLFLLILLFASTAFAQEKGTTIADIQKVVNDTLASKWYERIQMRGYAHFRYNRLLESNKDVRCASCDKSLGDKQGFFMRRARLTFFGEVSDKVYIYIQPDYAQDARAEGQNYLQIRDAYFDYALTDDKEWRVRTGITKVPYGFVNLQSSSNRGPLDRDEAMNTGVPNERDTGVFLMYAPDEIRKRFKELTSNNLKGTGDYGLIAIGAYNGQTLNRAEKNNDLHRVVRLTYPFKLKNGQFIETSLQAYEGKYTLDKAPGPTFYDQRSAASFIVYPQPIGFQVEYNIGTGPEYDRSSNSVKDKKLKGGYAQVNYQTSYLSHRFFPYLRYQEYKGGRKLEDGKSYRVTEWELGTEWQPNPAFELTVAYGIMDRLTQSSLTDKMDEKGSLLRLQAQFNY
jgi:hypothetical protein